ncbi:MAG: hypothetical protein ABIG61_05575 [Planctomycetota bacterium]
MSTPKENLKKVLTGQTPDWVPFAMKFCQWYQHHKIFGTLPPELKSADSYIEAAKLL